MADTVKLTYSKAMTELKEIVDDMRTSENVDVDDLVQNVARAKTLIDFCDQRIQKADMEIKNVIQALQGSTPAENTPTGTDTAPESTQVPTKVDVEAGAEEDIPF